MAPLTLQTAMSGGFDQDIFMSLSLFRYKLFVLFKHLNVFSLVSVYVFSMEENDTAKSKT